MATENIPGRRNGRKAAKRTNRAYYTDHLTGDIDIGKQLITGYWVTCDTVEILSDERITNSDYAALIKLAGSVYGPWTNRGYKTSWGIRVHQPSIEVLFYLTNQFAGCKETRFDAALNIQSDSPEKAALLRSDMLPLILTQPWRADRLPKLHKRTHYWGDKGDRRNLVLYLKSPTTTRLEFRYKHADMCRRRSVTKPTDLLDWDLARFIDHDARLSVLNWEKGGQLIADEARQWANNRRKWLRYLWPREFHSHDRDRVADWLREVCEYRVCRMVPEDEFTPIPDWQDRANFPAQHCVDALPLLAKALVREDASALVRDKAAALMYRHECTFNPIGPHFQWPTATRSEPLSDYADISTAC
jgi:hypothetical protein